MRSRVRYAAAVVALTLACCGVPVTLVKINATSPYWRLVLLAVLLVGCAVPRVDRWICDRLTQRRLAAEGWQGVPVDQPWPWLALLEHPGQTTVRRAWTRTVDRLPVTVGEITWDGHALVGAVAGFAGLGVFVVVELPAPTDPMALRRPHRAIGTSHRLDFPAMREAYKAGEIPPWTVADDRLFTFTEIPGRIWADTVQLAVRRTLLAVRLLDLGPIDERQNPRST